MPLVLLLDEDDTGCQNGAKLAAELEARNIPCLIAETALEGFHDPNDRLLRDRVGLTAAIAAVREQTAALPDPREAQRQEYLATSASHALPEFLAMVEAGVTRPRLSTGFSGLDEILGGGLFPGLYVVGAISSLGKTTLTLQIADTLAQAGQDVLFFSLEQSRFDLMSKSLSRETYLYCRAHHLPTSYARSNLSVLDGRRWQEMGLQERQVMEGAMERYRAYAGHSFIHEGIGNISVADIRERVRAHIAVTGNKCPVVCIDYLQILRAAPGDERSTDKQIVDHNVTALKQLSRDFDIPVVAVSSLNRANYSEKINMAAFKESGAIEYGSDVLLGLQLSEVGESGFDVNTAKAKSPREIDLCVLKNRNGRTTDKGLALRYYPQFNAFFGDEDEGDGFRTLTPEEQKHAPF